MSDTSPLSMMFPDLLPLPIANPKPPKPAPPLIPSANEYCVSETNSFQVISLSPRPASKAVCTEFSITSSNPSPTASMP